MGLENVRCCIHSTGSKSPRLVSLLPFLPLQIDRLMGSFSLLHNFWLWRTARFSWVIRASRLSTSCPEFLALNFLSCICCSQPPPLLCGRRQQMLTPRLQGQVLPNSLTWRNSCEGALPCPTHKGALCKLLMLAHGSTRKGTARPHFQWQPSP